MKLITFLVITMVQFTYPCGPEEKDICQSYKIDTLNFSVPERQAERLMKILADDKDVIRVDTIHTFHK